MGPILVHDLALLSLAQDQSLLRGGPLVAPWLVADGCDAIAAPGIYSFSMELRAAWISALHCCRKACASFVYRPCFQAPLASPFGAPLRAPWKRHTVEPLTTGA
jgi:hypothetical protein